MNIEAVYAITHMQMCKAFQHCIFDLKRISYFEAIKLIDTLQKSGNSAELLNASSTCTHPVPIKYIVKREIVLQGGYYSLYTITGLRPAANKKLL